MTMQITDQVLLDRVTYHAIGGRGGPLATPEFFDMKSEMLNTACYRGYHAVYAVEQQDLTLREFTLREESGNYRPIAGVAALGLPQRGIYRDLKVAIPFTGMLRLARGFIRDLDHLRPSPLAFLEVLDLTFEKGRVLASRERTAEVAELRRQRQAGETSRTELE
jgi:hypothetical protein